MRISIRCFSPINRSTVVYKWFFFFSTILVPNIDFLSEQQFHRRVSLRAVFSAFLCLLGVVWCGLHTYIINDIFNLGEWACKLDRDWSRGGHVTPSRTLIGCLFLLLQGHHHGGNWFTCSVGPMWILGTLTPTRSITWRRFHSATTVSSAEVATYQGFQSDHAKDKFVSNNHHHHHRPTSRRHPYIDVIALCLRVHTSAPTRISNYY